MRLLIAHRTPTEFRLNVDVDRRGRFHQRRCDRQKTFLGLQMQLTCVVEVLFRECRGDFVYRDGLSSVVSGEDGRQRGPNAVSMRTLCVNLE